MSDKRCSGKTRRSGRNSACQNPGFHQEDGKWYCDHHIPKVDAFWRDRAAKLRKIASVRANVMKRWRKKEADILDAADIACTNCSERKSQHAKVDLNDGKGKTPNIQLRCYRKEFTWKGKRRIEERVLTDYCSYSRNWKEERVATEKAGFDWSDAHEEARQAADAKKKELFPDGED